MDEDIDYGALVDLIYEEVPPEHVNILLEMADAWVRGEESDLEKRFKSIPVDFETFVTSEEFLNKPGVIYDVIMECLIELNSGNYIECILTGGIGCLDIETEFLSPDGWVSMAEYDGQLVAQYNNGVAEFVIPEKYIDLPSSGFYHLKTKYGIDQMLSPEHRVYYRNYKGEQHCISAVTLAHLHNGLEKGWNGKFDTTFLPPEREGVDLTDDKIRVQVAVQADGYFAPHRKSGTYVSVNCKKKRKKDRIRYLLSSSGISWHEGPSSPGYVRFGFQAPLRTKRYSDWAWKANQKQLEIIVDEALKWDAHGTTFYSTDKSDADFMQYAMCACNYRAVISVDRRENRPVCYGVQANLNRRIGIQGVPKTPITWYPAKEGQRKYCFTVPSGAFIARRNGKVFITGNSGKTTMALYTTAYQLYLVSCYTNPHAEFNLDPSSEIQFIFQSINATLARQVDYQRFRRMIETAPYFQKHFKFNKDIEAKLVFPNRIEVVPVSGLETAAIGQNVIGGVIDELNYMAVIENTRSRIDGGVYDQATALYNSISRRRKTRFLRQGTMPGILCLVSSKRYPGQFTDVKEEERAREISETGSSSIYLYDKRAWEVKPDDYSGEVFYVFIGDEIRKARILGDGELVPPEDRDLVIGIPIELKADFERDLLNALREMAGISTLARFPYILELEKIAGMFGQSESILSSDHVDFDRTSLKILPDRVRKKHLLRFAHVDLGLNSDSAGVAMGFADGFEVVDEGGARAIMPRIHFDFLLTVAPPRQGEIQFWKIRKLFKMIRDQGIKLTWITYDSYQSVDSLQLLRQLGFITGHVSLDKTSLPYDVTKTAIYDERMFAPVNSVAKNELASLERDPKTGKINHPVGGSKDLADAIAGVTYGLTMRRRVWIDAGIPMGRIPKALLEAMAKERQKDQKSIKLREAS